MRHRTWGSFAAGSKRVSPPSLASQMTPSGANSMSIRYGEGMGWSTFDHTRHTPVSNPPPGSGVYGNWSAESMARPPSPQNVQRAPTHRLPSRSKAISRTSSPGMPVVLGRTWVQTGSVAAASAALPEISKERKMTDTTAGLCIGIPRGTVRGPRS